MAYSVAQPRCMPALLHMPFGRALLEDRMAFPRRGLDGYQIGSTQRYDVFKEHPRTAALGSGTVTLHIKHSHDVSEEDMKRSPSTERHDSTARMLTNKNDSGCRFKQGLEK
ncbi:hypothetical protein EYF80_004517 [Liparis tanakae]|uniref:Uncharacterized protein n=1 Tax=Liparis tanakae TaxID=230148 RepID=A0A4Z2J573_9TELE|nr:hypothetical protein EYF80_004517 [Liparis tanakae]